MANTQIPTLKAGLSRLRENPQLWWTVFVAIVIFIAFVFIANLFVTIAQDAQDRLINVRVGSIHDTLVQYVNQAAAEPDKLARVISNITAQNPTIMEFRIVSVTLNDAYIVASNNPDEVGMELVQRNPLTTFAFADPNNSFTTEVVENNERFYQTVRAFTDGTGGILGYIETKQTLSQADQLINDNIRKSMAIFVAIVVVVMFLFLRHAKIIDYVSLYKQLQEVDQLKDDFISMASHELKTPLAVIRGYAEFLRESRDLSEENRDYAERIDRSSLQLAELVENMLDVSRIEQDRMKFEFSDVNISEFATEMIENFKIQAGEKNLAISLEQEGDKDMLLKADKNKLREIFVNLIGNSIKYTKQGSVVLKVNSKKDQFVEFRVSDTGVGMTQEEQKDLFQKFYRIKNEDTQDVSGTGLGLWITKQLVEKMGGTISVESIKDKGTDFVVNFPIK